MSRYLVQMSYNPIFTCDFRSVHISVGRSRIISERLPRTSGHNGTLAAIYGEGTAEDKYLSPSAINTWLNCRMRFYYRYVCGMPEEEVLEKDIDQRRFGNILHNTLEILYRPLKGITDVAMAIGRMSSDHGLIRKTIESSAMDEMKWNHETLMAGRGIIIIDVLERYIMDLLKYDSEIKDLSILALEDSNSRVVTVNSGTGEATIRIGGRADRIDMTGGIIRVVDYKTGMPKREAIRPEDLFDEDKDKRNDALVQAMLYCHLLSEQYSGKIILPAVYWVQQISSEDFSPYVSLSGIDGPESEAREWKEVMDRFAEGLNLTINRIFSESEDFIMTRFDNRCKWCPYRLLCRR